MCGKMIEKDLKSSRTLDLVNCLLEDPTRSISKIAEKSNMYRRTVWRKKGELEEDHTIWGYTTVIDESKLGHVLYVALFRIKPILSREFADLIIERLTTRAPSKEGVRVIDILYINGYYDIVIRFSAPDHAIARMYYETLRSTYNEYFLEDPLLCDVNFSLIRTGKVNPELEKLYNFIPKVKTKIRA